MSDLLTQLKEIRRRRKATRRLRFEYSRIDRYQSDLLKLRYDGLASFQDLVEWLKYQKRITVHRTTISRRFKKWGAGK